MLSIYTDFKFLSLATRFLQIADFEFQKRTSDWKQAAVSISDDSDKTSDASLQFRQNNLSDIIVAQKPFINVKKILMDSYVQEASAGG